MATTVKVAQALVSAGYLTDADGEAAGISADGKWYQIQISTDYAPDGIGWVNGNYLIKSNTENLPVTQSQYCP